mgnify:FL=1
MKQKIDYEGILRDEVEFMEEDLQDELNIKPEVQEVQEVQEEEIEEGPVLGAGDKDLRNHPLYEELHLDIPFQEGEGKFGYTEKYPEIYTGRTNQENAQIFYKRKHALKGDVPMEIRNSIYKGGIDLVSSVLTFPERLVDMTPFVGQMKRGPDGGMINRYTGEKYELDWDPLGNVKDPWQNSWWGTLVQGVTKYGLGGRLFKAAGVKGLAAQEGAVAAISEYSQGDNVTGQIAQRLPWTRYIFGSIASNDKDSPLTLTLKNVLEELSLGRVFDHLLGVHNPTTGAIVAQSRRANVDDQILKKGAAELAEELEYDKTVRTQKALPTSAITKQGDVIDVDVIPDPLEITGATDNLIEGSTKPKPTVEQTKSGFRGHKNKPLAQPGQGSPTSNYEQGDLFGIYRQLNRIDDSYGAEKNIGSTDSVMSPLQAEKASRDSGYSVKFLKEKAIELLGEDGFKDMMKDFRSRRVGFTEGFEPAYRRVQEIMGRNTSAQTVEDFWEPIIRDKPGSTGGGVWMENQDYWSVQNVLIADMINGALFKELRNLGIAGKELINDVDVFARDGLMQSIEDKLIVGLSNAKRTRYFMGSTFGDLKRIGTTASAKTAKDTIKNLHDETVNGVRLMMDVIKKTESDELAEALLEVFQFSSKIHNFQDFDAWMRAKLMGGEFDGKQNVGAVIRELQSLSVNSILSGFKTPLRAIIGTTGNAYANSINQFIGASIRAGLTGDTRLMRTSLAHTQGMFNLIPDALKVFKRNLDVNFSKDVATIKSRYTEFEKTASKQWEMYGKFVNERLAKNPNQIRAQADVAAYSLANVARTLNNNRLFSWSPRVLSAVDDTFRHLMARAKSKERAFKDVYDAVNQNTFAEITPELLRNAEDLHFSQYFDELGDFSIDKDRALQYQFKEATLTSDLDAFGKDLENLFNAAPLIRPFYLFARTGINGLKMNVKNMPLFSILLRETQEIALGTAAKLQANPAKYAKFGIESIDDLKQAQNLLIGRQAMGTAVVYIAAQKYLAGQLTGNGPADRSQRAMWSDTGWMRKTITVGGVRVGYQTLEPYDLIFSIVADIGDNMKLMGPEWGTQKLRLLRDGIATGFIEKSYLQGITDLADWASGEPGAGAGRIAGNIMNSYAFFPIGSGLRNDIGKLLNPYMRELNKNIWDSIRNRNLAMESFGVKGVTGKLPIKYDMLTGKPLRDWNFFESIFNAISPVSLSLQPSPGRTLLHKSGYDLRLSVLSAPNGKIPVSLAKSNVARSLFQKAIGDYRNNKGQNLEEIFNEMAENPSVLASIAIMNKDLASFDDDVDPLAYTHNKLIKKQLDKARGKAWASIRKHPEIQRLIQEAKQREIDKNAKTKETSIRNTSREAQKILNRKNK